MECSIEYGIYIDSQTMKYISSSLSLPLCLPLSCFLLFLPTYYSQTIVHC